MPACKGSNMSQLDDNAYYIRRVAEKLERGARAPNASVAAVHHELARHYSMLIARVEQGKKRVTFVNSASEQLAA